ncbi:MAG TPA: ABC transporter ATP-binding protein [Candidatus Acidoferrales bacterium]|nr:ABC transporter ATP-binding protein [Candidatus Acidoferrales bacterium]
MAVEIHEEEILGKAYDARLMRRLLHYLKPYWWQVAVAIVITIVYSWMGPVRPYLTQIAIDKYIRRGDGAGLFKIIELLFAVTMAQALLRYGSAYLTQWIGQKTIFDIRMEIYKHLHNLGIKYFDRNPVGRLVTRVTNDVEALNDLFSSGIVMAFGDVFTIIWILIYMFGLSASLAVVTLLVLPILAYITMLFRKKVRAAYRQVRLHIARMNAFLQEHISGVIVDQIHNRERRALHSFEEVSGKLKDANVKSVFYYALFYPGVEATQAIAVGLIIWYGGTHLVPESVLQSNGLTIGVLIAFLQFTEQFFMPIRDLSEKYNILQTAMASSERIFKVIDDKTIVPEPDVPLPLENVEGKIEFKNVTFAYDDQNYVLKNVSFTANPGETIAIVGATGAGKTSIVNLLMRFYDVNNGGVFIDGVNVKDISTAELRKNIAIVMQDVFLFSGSVRDNISLGNNKIGFEKIEKASALVGADDFIKRLPKKYDDDVKERGAALSVGQKQLISFARALAYDPRILILDEATANIDTETEQLIQEATENLLRGRTSIVIAHRLSTIQHSSKIIVLHKGEIREQGTHQELIALGGIYYRLYQLQYKEQERLGQSRVPPESLKRLAPSRVMK